MSSELTFPIRPASEAPTRSKPSFQVRRRSAAELPPHMVGETLLRAYRTPLLQFIADWNRSPAKADMIEKGLVYLSGEGVCDSGNSTGGCSFEPESGLVMTSENHPVEVFNYGSEAFFR